MEKCSVCGTESSDMVCPCCGFIRPRMMGDKQMYDEMLKGLAEEYRKSLKIDSEITTKVYTYKMLDGRLVEDQMQEVILTENYREEQRDSVLWNDREFGRMEAGSPLELSGYIRNGEKEQGWKVSTFAPDTKGLWKLGIRILDGLRFALLLECEGTVFVLGSISVRI